VVWLRDPRLHVGPVHRSGVVARGAEVPGIEAVQGFLTEWTQAFDEWAYAIDEAIDCGEQVVLVVHERGRIKGTATEVGGTWAYLSTLHDARVSKTQVFLTKDEALEAAGLRD
jgi:hypothetical protein